MADEQKGKAPEAGSPAPPKGEKSFDILTGSKKVGGNWVPQFKSVRNIRDLHDDLTVPGGRYVGEGSDKKFVTQPVHESRDGKSLVCTTIDGKKHAFEKKTGAVLYGLALLAMLLIPVQALRAQYGVGRTDFNSVATEAPYVTQNGVSATYTRASGLYVNNTAGKIYLGGAAVSVSASQTLTTASKTNCDGPAYSSCNIIYANSSGTVASTATLSTARAYGNTILAYVETSATAVTSIIYPWQMGLIDTPIATFGAYCTGTVGTSEADYLNNAACSGATTSTIMQVVPTAGTIRNLYVKAGTAVKTAGTAVTATVEINGVASAVTCSMAADASSCSDTTHSAAVAAGDNIGIALGTSNASDTLAKVGARLELW